jgi:hypothetical protein
MSNLIERLKSAVTALRVMFKYAEAHAVEDAIAALQANEDKAEVIKRFDAALQAKQAKIDALMWEFCPDEMTSEQITEWKKHQALSGEGG